MATRSKNKKTRNPGYKAGDNWLICDVCGCAIYASEALQRWDGMVTCKKDWEPRHEQDFVRARKDKIAAELVRPEGEDDYVTIPGISGPDPLPPEPGFLFFIHDFSKDKMGPFSVRTNEPSTVLTSNAERLPVGTNVPSLTGYAWDGVGKYTDLDVGIGVESVKSNDCTIVAYSKDAFQGGSQFSIECCGMIVFYLDEDISAGQYLRVFSFDSQSSTNLAAVTIFTGTEDHSLVLAAKTDNTSGGAGNGWSHAQMNDLSFRAGDKIDCRFKFSFTTGLELWFPDLDRKVQDSIDIPPNIPTDNLDRIGISNSSGGQYDFDITACYILLAATDACTEEEILSWPTWDEPLPIIDRQPAPQSVAVDEGAVFTTIVRHPYPTYQWTMDDAPVGTNTNQLTIAVDTPGTYNVKCTINNRGGDTVTTNTVPLEVI